MSENSLGILRRNILRGPRSPGRLSPGSAQVAPGSAVAKTGKLFPLITSAQKPIVFLFPICAGRRPNLNTCLVRELLNLCLDRIHNGSQRMISHPHSKL